jgi:ParB/RepB/Spo0J family partition protein
MRKKMQIKNVGIENIFRDKEQPRKYFDEEAMERLVQSIKDNGIESPIIIRPDGTIIDGERRWKASQQAGLKEIPCIITDKTDILEQQLRSDCLKEGLTVDELDRAIYRYYDIYFRTTSEIIETRGGNKGYELVAKKIGKSDQRIRKAIDRFEFKRDNAEFTKEIEQKHNPEKKRFSKVNSVISMTDKLKNKPEVRKAVVEKILDDRKAKKFGIDNDTYKKQIEIIDKRNIDNPEDAKTVMKDLQLREEPIKFLKNDPNYLLQKQYFEFNKYADSFYHFDFESVKENLHDDILKKFIDSADKFIKYLKKMEA